MGLSFVGNCLEGFWGAVRRYGRFPKQRRACFANELSSSIVTHLDRKENVSYKLKTTKKEGGGAFFVYNVSNTPLGSWSLVLGWPVFC